MSANWMLRISVVVPMVLLVVWAMAFPAVYTALAQDPLGAGPSFLISSPSGDDQYPAVAYNPTRHTFLVVWETAGGIAGGIVSGQGKVVTAEFSINGMFGYVAGSRPAVAYNDASDTFLVVWSQYVGGVSPHTDIYAQRYAGDGTSSAGDFWVSSTGGAFHPQVSTNSHDVDFLAVWESNGSIHGQRVWGAGGGSDLWGSPFTVAQQTTGVGYDIWHSQPDVAYDRNQNRFLVVFTRQDPGSNPATRDVHSRLVNGDGTMPWGETIIDPSSYAQYDPIVAAYPLNPGRPFLVVYNDQYGDHFHVDVTARQLDASGSPVSGWLCVACVTGRSESMPDVAASDDLGYTVVWQEYTSDWDIWGRRVSPNASLDPVFDISLYGWTPVGLAEQVPAIADGAPVPLVAWQSDGWGSGTWDVAGRLLGFRGQLPVVRR